MLVNCCSPGVVRPDNVRSAYGTGGGGTLVQLCDKPTGGIESTRDLIFFLFFHPLVYSNRNIFFTIIPPHTHTHTRGRITYFTDGRCKRKKKTREKKVTVGHRARRVRPTTTTWYHHHHTALGPRRKKFVIKYDSPLFAVLFFSNTLVRNIIRLLRVRKTRGRQAAILGYVHCSRRYRPYTHTVYRGGLRSRAPVQRKPGRTAAGSRTPVSVRRVVSSKPAGHGAAARTAQSAGV